MVNVYIGKVESLEGNYERAFRYLDYREKKRAERFKIQEDKNVYILSSIMKRIIGEVEFGENWKKYIETGSHGKPYFKNSTFDFNFTGTKDYIYCGVTSHKNTSIGVDAVDLQSEAIVYDSFKQGSFTESQLEHIGDSNERMFTYWGLKEAYLKCIGVGLLRDDLKRIGFTKNTNDSINVYYDGELQTDMKARVWKKEQDIIFTIVIKNGELSNISELEIDPVKVLETWETGGTLNPAYKNRLHRTYEFEAADYLIDS